MTEPKKEKCEACCGSGYINFWTDDGHISMRTCRRCDGYGYIKAKPMTNEEYLRSLNTEQLAEWLGDKLDYCQIMWYWACDKCTWSKKHESCMNDKEKWVEWLKQPHTNE